ncbi:Rossmann-like and DUF2520 domain-containing protein [Leucothrix arctica]|uniref:DUF2520 domain-containing protein n=1 Tax=Leucothrix arctica TaxID=1481894 RepID=A0A317C8F4_9GAMM|nr:Rossmann-like and DUF2520 domain-containing protein [Leucothrix arctica]PWQ94577.1 DUF2520 domain-containing protein [Leucothrix arctica]
MLRINFIGCGQVGKTLGKLWHKGSHLKIGDVLNQSLLSSETAVEVINAGKPVDNLVHMTCADVYMIGCGDDSIEQCSQDLANSGLLKQGGIVFHCSGAQPASLLSACKDKGVYIASIHPIKSFANVQLAVDSFEGTYCGMEGDEIALQKLEPLFNNIGARLVKINSDNKSLYHAASVIACNYLVALQELSINTFAQAGIERGQAMAILQPIVRGTVENIFTLGTVSSLTGPIARGDKDIVSNQLNAISDWNQDFATVYQLLGKVSVDIASKKEGADITKLKQIRDLLEKG